MSTPSTCTTSPTLYEAAYRPPEAPRFVFVESLREKGCIDRFSVTVLLLILIGRANVAEPRSAVESSTGNSRMAGALGFSQSCVHRLYPPALIVQCWWVEA